MKGSKLVIMAVLGGMHEDNDCVFHDLAIFKKFLLMSKVLYNL